MGLALRVADRPPKQRECNLKRAFKWPEPRHSKQQSMINIWLRHHALWVRHAVDVECLVRSRVDSSRPKDGRVDCVLPHEIPKLEERTRRTAARVTDSQQASKHTRHKTQRISCAHTTGKHTRARRTHAIFRGLTAGRQVSSNVCIVD
jgi:hypothetical protein